MKKALVLTWEKFQDHEVIYPFYALKQEGFEVDVAANEQFDPVVIRVVAYKRES